MRNLVESLADLSSLRDREALDFAFVSLIWQYVDAPMQAVRLLRLVGEMGDQRWQTNAALTEGDTQPSRDRVWVDFNTLPRVMDYPERQLCVLEGAVQQLTTIPALTIFPMGGQGRVEGVFEVQSASVLEASTIELVEAFLKIYRNVQGLLDYGEKDSLTELLNRKTFDGAFIKATLVDAQSREYDQPDRRVVQAASYWLAVIDIDFFKRVNDTYGHLIGDEVLVLLARLMRASFRFNDQLYRFGGEEFVLLIRCSNADDANAALERFRNRVLAHEFPQAGHITVSIGYTPLAPDDTPGAAFDRADKAVYYAKSHGRNQVCSYPALVAAGEIVELVEDSQEADFF
ncbi:MAG: GGDEF domain-containing protein [Rhodoferax sp.]